MVLGAGLEPAPTGNLPFEGISLAVLPIILPEHKSGTLTHTWVVTNKSAVATFHPVYIALQIL